MYKTSQHGNFGHYPRSQNMLTKPSVSDRTSQVLSKLEELMQASCQLLFSLQEVRGLGFLMRNLQGTVDSLQRRVEEFQATSSLYF